MKRKIARAILWTFLALWVGGCVAIFAMVVWRAPELAPWYGGALGVIGLIAWAGDNA
jgi:hypothetical protein